MNPNRKIDCFVGLGATACRVRLPRSCEWCQDIPATWVVVDIETGAIA